MRSSYSINDVEILLKDVTGLLEPLPASEREKKIQSGTHYSEMLPLEYEPSQKYMDAYRTALYNYAGDTAEAIAHLSELLFKKRGKNLVIVSLARAGIPIGILIKRYIFVKYSIEVKHYAISIIRGKGIDSNALDYILKNHKSEDIQFVDGWIGKGAILRQLESALSDYPEISPELGVVSDPANLVELCGTHKDILIPSSCLNATVTGLISRTILREDLIGEKDFHGAVFYEEMKGIDLSNQFLIEIEKRFRYYDTDFIQEKEDTLSSKEIISNIQNTYKISDINFIKPGIGETTRVLLRRIPWKIIINDAYYNSQELTHIKQLANEKNVHFELSKVKLGNYKCCGIIQDLADM